MSPGRRLLQIVLLVATAIVLVVAAALVALQTPWARDWLRGLAERQASKYLRGEVKIGALGGSLFFGARLDDVSVVQDGTRVIQVDRASVDYSVFELLAGQLAFREIDLVRPVVRLDRGEAGWGLAGLVAPRKPKKNTAPPAGFQLERIVMKDGTIIVGNQPRDVGGFRVPATMTDVDATLAVERGNDATRIRIERLSLHGEEPRLIVEQVEGMLVLEGRDLKFDTVRVRTADSAFTLNGSIDNLFGPPAPRPTATGGAPQ